MRLFIAIDFSDAVKQQFGKLISQLRKEAPNVRWEKPEKIHLTLAFLGSVFAKKLVEVEKTMKKSVHGIRPFTLSFSNFGFFLKSGRLVIWLGIADSQELTALKTRLDRKVGKLGFRIEKRPFSPHVTLARKKRAGREGKWEEFVSKINRQKSKVTPFMVREIVLVESKLTGKGSVYKILKRVRLGE